MSLKRKTIEVFPVSPSESSANQSRPPSPENLCVSLWMPPESNLQKASSIPPKPEITVSARLPPVAIETDGIIKPHDNDILCKRPAGRAVKHPGNKRFRNLIETWKDMYKSCSQENRAVVAIAIVDCMSQMDPPGRFLEQDPRNGQWFDIGRMKAIQKACGSLAQAKRRRKRKTAEETSKSTRQESSTDGQQEAGTDNTEEKGGNNTDTSMLSTTSPRNEGLKIDDDQLIPLPYTSKGKKSAPYDQDFVNFMKNPEVLDLLFDGDPIGTCLKGLINTS